MPRGPLKRKSACDRKSDSALTAGERPFIIAAVMGITRQVGEMSSSAWGQAARGRRAEGTFCTTMSLREQDWRHKCRPERNDARVRTLSFYL